MTDWNNLILTACALAALVFTQDAGQDWSMHLIEILSPSTPVTAQVNNT